MRFHPTGTDPTSTALLVCRNARWNLVVLWLIFAAMPFGWWYLAAPKWVLNVSGAIPLLIAWPIFGSFRKRSRADNWVLAVAGDGLWLNLRDCEYADAEPGATVVFIPHRQLAAVRYTTHRYTTPSRSSGGGTRRHRDVYLELCLAEPDDGSLQQAIQEEWRRTPPKRHFLRGIITVGTRRRHSPIEIVGRDAVRIKFSTSNYGLRPGLKKVLDLLARFVRVDEDANLQTANWRALDDAEADDLVCRLVQSGQSIEAIGILQTRRGMSLTEAKRFVDQLSSPADDSADDSASFARSL